MGINKEELLEKARRDLSKLIKVTRQVSKNGKMFDQTYYVRPDAIKDTDKVLGATPDLTEEQVKKFAELEKTDRKKALEYLKTTGLVWNECDHDGKNWMRAKRALMTAARVDRYYNPLPEDTSPKAQARKQRNVSNKRKVVETYGKYSMENYQKLAEKNGVLWKKDDNPAINFMRLNASLKAFFENGGVLDTQGINDKETEENLKKEAEEKAKKEAEEKAKKAKEKKEKAKKDKDSTKLDVDKITKSIKDPREKERKKNIAELINKIDDKDDLLSFTKVGMVPEDNTSKNFILNKLVPKYEDFTATRNTSGREETIISMAKSDLKLPFCNNLGVMIFQKPNLANLGRPQNGAPLMDESWISGTWGHKDLTFTASYPGNGIYTALNNSFSDYGTDDYKLYKTNYGYTGYDHEEYKKRYDLEKEGFVRSMRHIQKEQPNLSDECEKMIKEYDSIMKEVDGDPVLLKELLHSNKYDTDMDYFSAIPLDKYNGVNGRSLIGSPKAAQKIVDDFTKFKEEMDKYMIDHVDFSKSAEESDEEFFSPVGNHYSDMQVHIGEVIDKLVIQATNYSIKGLETFYRNMYLKEHGAEPKDPYVIDYFNHAKVLSNISFDTMKKVKQKWNSLLGVEVTDGFGVPIDTSKTKEDDLFVPISLHGSTFYADKIRPKKSASNARLDVVVNLNLMKDEVKMLNRVSADSAVYQKPQKANNQGKNLENVWSFYNAQASGSASMQDRRSRTGDIIGSKDISLKEQKDLITQQLKNATTYSSDIISNATKRVKELDENKNGLYTLGGYQKDPALVNIVRNKLKDDDPLKIMMANNIRAVARYSEKIKKDKIGDVVAKMIGVSADTKDMDIKKLRQDLYKATNCTVATESKEESAKLKDKFMDNWDYKDGVEEKTPDGFTHKNRIYSGKHSYGGYDRRALFNSRFFKIKNSNFTSKYEDKKQELESTYGKDSKEATPLHAYHGTSYAATAGVLGKTGGWFMGKQFTKAGKALGTGAYFGTKAGKSLPYCGDSAYAGVQRNGADGDAANGCYIVADILRGQDYVDSRTDKGRFRDFEIAIKDNALISPQYFVDVSVRSLGVNVKRDNNKNYLDANGNITHDKDGNKIDME